MSTLGIIALQAPAVPILYVATLVAGIAFAIWMRAARPRHFAELALVEHRPA